MPGKAGKLMVEVEVDPGTKINCIPLYKFQTLYHMCRNGLPKERALEPTESEFISYSSSDLIAHRHLTTDMQHIATKEHPIRLYILETPTHCILMSHTASFWIGLVKVLCPNKASRVMRQVASIDKKTSKSNFKSKDSHIPSEDTSTVFQHVSKTVCSEGVPRSKGHSLIRSHNSQDGKYQ